MGSCLDFMSVLEGEANVVDAVDGGEVQYAVLAFKGELRQCIRQGLEALKENFNVGSLSLPPIQLGHNRLKALFGSFKTLGQYCSVSGIRSGQGRHG